MTDTNILVLIGRITKDAELSYTSGGTAKLETGIAVNRSVKKNEQWVDEVSFFNITLWGKTAENLKQYLTKGQQVAISGHLQQERWQDKNGKNQSRIVIVSENVQLLGGRKDNASETPAQCDKEFKEDIPF